MDIKLTVRLLNRLPWHETCLQYFIFQWYSIHWIIPYCNKYNITMSTPTVPVTPPVHTITAAPTRASAIGHLQKIADAGLAFSGKPGYNPHLFLNEKVFPLASILKDAKATDKEVTEAIANAMKLTDAESNFAVFVPKPDAIPTGPGANHVLPPKG